jgi:hypothetical protein
MWTLTIFVSCRDTLCPRHTPSNSSSSNTIKRPIINIQNLCFPLRLRVLARDPISISLLFSPHPSSLRGELNFLSFNRPPAFVDSNTDKPAETGATQRTDRLCCVVNGREHRLDLPAPASRVRGTNGQALHSVRLWVRPHFVAPSPSIQRTCSRHPRPEFPEQDSAPPAHPRRKRGLWLPCQRCRCLVELCTARHDKHIGPPASAGRNALPASRFHACFRSRVARPWSASHCVRIIPDEPLARRRSAEGGRRSAEGGKGRDCASQTCTIRIVTGSTSFRSSKRNRRIRRESFFQNLSSNRWGSNQRAFPWVACSTLAWAWSSAMYSHCITDVDS